MPSTPIRAFLLAALASLAALLFAATSASAISGTAAQAEAVQLQYPGPGPGGGGGGGVAGDEDTGGGQGDGGDTEGAGETGDEGDGGLAGDDDTVTEGDLTEDDVQFVAQGGGGDGDLPFTGLEAGWPAGIGLLLLLAGVALRVRLRRAGGVA